MSRWARGSVVAAAVVLGGVIVVAGRSRPSRTMDRPATPKVAVSEMQLRRRSYPPLPTSDTGETQPVAPAAPDVPTVDGQQEQAMEAARVSAEIDKLTKTVRLSENQRARAATIIKTVEHARTMIARRPEGVARQERERQLDKQAQLALLAVVTSEQAPLVASYFDAR